MDSHQAYRPTTMSPAHSPAASFHSLPGEILSLVFQGACDDGGATARSLASVCRSFYAQAYPLVYHALVVHDMTRVKLLIEHFRRQPRRAPSVQHILVAERTTELNCLEFENALKTLWGFVSSTLRSLTLIVQSRDHKVQKVFQTVLDASFPRLTDLTLCGDHPIPTSPLAMPLLQRFHTAGLTKSNAAGCFTPFTESCPKFSHLRISMGSESNVTFAISAAFGLPDAPTDIERMCLDRIPVPGVTDTENNREATYIPFPCLPRGLISLVVKPTAPPMPLFAGGTSMFYNQYLKQLKALVPACPPGKFTLLPAFKRAMWDVEGYGLVEAKRDWVDCTRGGSGAWGTAKSS